MCGTCQEERKDFIAQSEAAQRKGDEAKASSLRNTAEGVKYTFNSSTAVWSSTKLAHVVEEQRPYVLIGNTRYDKQLIALLRVSRRLGVSPSSPPLVFLKPCFFFMQSR
jgi:hypothetical protein